MVRYRAISSLSFQAVFPGLIRNPAVQVRFVMLEASSGEAEESQEWAVLVSLTRVPKGDTLRPFFSSAGCLLNKLGGFRFRSPFLTFTF
jgi:hypothetical protein